MKQLRGIIAGLGLGLLLVVGVHGEANRLALRQIRQVALAQPTRFLRAGKMIETLDVLVLNVTVNNPLAFLPRDSKMPAILLGDTECELVRTPIMDGQAIVLAPVSEARNPLRIGKKGPAVSLPKTISKETSVYPNINALRAFLQAQPPLEKR